MSIWLDPTTAAEAKRLIQKNIKAAKTIQAELDQLNRGEHSTSFPEHARRDLEAQLASRADADAHFKRHLERLSPGAKPPAPRTPRKTKVKLGDRVMFVYAGPRYGKHANVEFLRSDGGYVVHVEGEPSGTILVVHPADVVKVTT